MRQNEDGFTLVELVIALALVATLALASTTFVFHALRTSDQIGNRLTALSNAQNAGYWLSNDSYMADDVIAANLTAPAILMLKWTDWGYGTSNTYWSATYSVDNLANGIGQLSRRLQSSGGVDQTTLVANDVYYDLSDPANSTNVTYQHPVITLKVAARAGNGNETRIYRIYQRPNF